MSFNAIRESKILEKISEFTVHVNNRGNIDNVTSSRLTWFLSSASARIHDLVINAMGTQVCLELFKVCVPS